MLLLTDKIFCVLDGLVSLLPHLHLVRALFKLFFVVLVLQSLVLEKHRDFLVLSVDDVFDVSHYDLAFEFVELDHFLLLLNILRINVRWFTEIHSLLNLSDALDLLSLLVLNIFHFFLNNVELQVNAALDLFIFLDYFWGKLVVETTGNYFWIIFLHVYFEWGNIVLFVLIIHTLSMKFEVLFLFVFVAF